MASDSGNMTVRLEPDKQKRLEAIASRMDRSRNWLINEAVDHYLDVYEWQEQKIREAMEDAGTAAPGRFLTSAEMDERLSRFRLS